MNTHTVNLAHTPSFYYALAYWLSAVVLLSANKKRYPRRRQAGISALFLLIICGFMRMTDDPNGVEGVIFILCMVIVFLLLFAFFLISAEMSRAKALYFTVRCFILGEFAACLEYQLFYFGLTAMGLPLNMLVNMVFLLAVHPLIFGLTYLIEQKYRDSNSDLVITGRTVGPVLLIGLLVYTLSNLSYFLPVTPFSSRDTLMIFAVHSLVDLSGVWILLSLHIYLCEISVRMEKEYLHKLLHMQKDNYRASAESVELINQKYHDLKHQIQLLRSEIKVEDKLQYLDEVERDIQSFEAQNKTGSKVLDTLLTAKSIKCHSLGISMTCVADGKELNFIRPADLSVLFGNALDNAIESSQKIQDESKRLIHVSVVRQKSFVRIRIENCYEGELNFVDGLPSTGKDVRYHGYGMKSIRSIVEKYDGSLMVKAHDGWFELRILFPAVKTPAWKDDPENGKTERLSDSNGTGS